jgi:hypothetical protein
MQIDSNHAAYRRDSSLYPETLLDPGHIPGFNRRMFLFDSNLVYRKADYLEIFPASGRAAVFLLGSHTRGRDPGIFGESSWTPALLNPIKAVDF